MAFFELEPSDLSNLNDSDLRELVARLCEAELISQNVQPSCVLWGGAQEAADGGLDIRIQDAGLLTNPGFIKRTNTGFQVKKNSMNRSSCIKEMTHNGVLKTVIEELKDKNGSYVIVSGKDDCTDKMLSDRLSGMNSVIESIPNSEKLHIDFLGRDRLCTWLRQYPGVSLWVRSRLGKPLHGWRPFGKWTSIPNNSEDTFLFNDYPCVIDFNSTHKNPKTIEEGINIVRDKLRKEGSVVRITGLSGVGKTRFAQALFEENVLGNPLPNANVIYADLGIQLSPPASELISYLLANDYQSYVILDNCPPDIHRLLQKQVSESNAKLSLLTIEYDISDDRPEETEVIHIDPCGEQTISHLIQIRFHKLGKINSDKIAEFSGGNARLAIALANGVSSDDTLVNFSDDNLYKRLFEQRKGSNDRLLESAEILSLVYSFNISKHEFNDELSVLSRISDIGRSQLNRDQSELLRRQLSQQRGDWRAILPHALANRLARRALQNIQPIQINEELLKKENLRLLNSCAHRLGYLHDFEPARTLARTWISKGGPFYNLGLCDDELLSAFRYIAPVFPEEVLNALENASESPEFCSRENRNFPVFVRLLRKIAYDAEYFERSTQLLLRFALTENKDENNNSIVRELTSLFSLYLSGTNAKPNQRQLFLKSILQIDDSRKLQIASELFRSALKTSQWTSIGSFDFGARKRDFGWKPKTLEAMKEWYEGFIQQLIPLLESDNTELKEMSKELIATNFYGLWSSGHCEDILEEIVIKYGVGKGWSELWLAIKRTIYYIKRENPNAQIKRLKKLQEMLDPSDLISEIEMYVLSKSWDHTDLKDGDIKRNSDDFFNKIKNLGVQTSTNQEILESLGSKLWSDQFNSLWAFGKGLSLGTNNQKSLFEYLIRLLHKYKVDNLSTNLLNGFLVGVHETNSKLCQELQESTLDIPILKPYFIEILTATPLSSRGVKLLVELAQKKVLDAKKFERIRYSCMHETISDADLTDLITALLEFDDGVFVSIEILGMRFYPDKKRSYIASNELKSIGTQVIMKLFSMKSEEIHMQQSHEIEIIINQCLSGYAIENEAQKIISLICDGLVTYRLEAYKIENIISYLVRKYPEYVLDRVFADNENSEFLVYKLFKDRFNHNSSPLNIVPVDRLLNWCDGDQGRIQLVAKSVSVFLPKDKSLQHQDTSNGVVLSEHIKSLLNVADNKSELLETVFRKTYPSSWSGSLANIFEIKSKALEEFLEYPSIEVQEIAKSKLFELKQRINEIRRQEAEDSKRSEQRFE